MELDEDQQQIVDEIVRRFKSHGDFNTAQILPAMTGMGKTRIAAHVIKILGLQPLVICPKILIPMWQDTLDVADVEPLEVMTYNRLSGYKGQCKHPYLEKIGTRYRVTKEWKKKKDVIVVCDESAAVKNKASARHKALFELISNLPSGSKILHLTASPIDSEKHWISLYRNLRLIKQEVMMTVGPKGTEYLQYGLGELFALANKYNKPLVKQVIEKYELKARKLSKMLLMLWRGLFQQHVVIPVTDPVYTHPDTGKPLKHTVVNYFANLDEKGKKEVDRMMKDLKDHGIIHHDMVDLKAFQQHFGQMQGALMALCRAKISTVIKLAKIKLKNKHRKVIISCPFIDDQKILKNALDDYGCLLLNGATKNRQRVLDAFNEPDDDVRVLVMSTEVGSEGISLHDTEGSYPRTLFIIPSFAFMKVFQAAGRVYRRGLMSDSEVYIVYANNGVLESVLINGMAKTETANSVLLSTERLYPGSYPYYIEQCNNKKEMEKLIVKEQESARIV